MTPTTIRSLAPMILALAGRPLNTRPAATVPATLLLMKPLRSIFTVIPSRSLSFIPSLSLPSMQSSSLLISLLRSNLQFAIFILQFAICYFLVPRHSSLLPHISCNLLMSREPDTGPRFHIIDQSLEYCHSRSMPGYMGMHCQNEHCTFLICAIELGAPDIVKVVRLDMRPDHREPVHVKVGIVVHYPL